MGVNLTPNLGLIMPDKSEPIPNWPAHNTTNCETIDEYCVVEEGTYFPTWTASATNPTLGAGGVLTGRFIKVYPHLVAFWVYLVAGGSGFNRGSGQYRLSLPFDGFKPDSLGTYIGSGILSDTPTFTLGRILSVFTLSGSNTSDVGMQIDTGSNWGATSPFNFNSGHSVSISGLYIS